MHRTIALPLLLTAACGLQLLFPDTLLAQAKPNTGYVAGTQDVLSSVPLADGRLAQRLLFQVAVTTDDPNNPFNLATQDCFASYIFENDVPVEGHGACDGISSDGDMWWLSVHIGDDGLVHWMATGGTGKFAGIESSGTTEIVAQWDDGKFVGRFQGTYRTK